MIPNEIIEKAKRVKVFIVDIDGVMTDEIKPQISLAVSQQTMSVQMTEEIRTVIKDKKYDRMYISTLMGILVMLQHELTEKQHVRILPGIPPARLAERYHRALLESLAETRMEWESRAADILQKEFKTS